MASQAIMHKFSNQLVKQRERNGKVVLRVCSLLYTKVKVSVFEKPLTALAYFAQRIARVYFNNASRLANGI